MRRDARRVSFWEERVLPPLTKWACGQRSVNRQRAKLVPRARGRVLELGVGAGFNLPHYDRDLVDEVIGVDPSAALRRDAVAQAAGLELPVQVLDGRAEALPVDAGSIDSVVVTFTLCTVPDVDRALAEVRRVLAPGGAVYFCEHGLAPDKRVRAAQRLIEPAWKRAGGGCHLTRDAPAAFTRAGFDLEGLESMYLPGLRPLTWNTWGIARP